MGVLSSFEPERVFYYFEEICKIPHGSYKEKQISDYIVAFAKQRGLEVYQDELYNVVMIVPATVGYEEEFPIILQGHTDMVCEKEDGCPINMDTDGLELYVEGDYIAAKGTTLGGDDGIAVAYMLAIAESETISHPRLELIFTVSEEVGMEGAMGIDLSMIKGHQMLNLDSEEEGIFIGSCAGGMSTCTTLPVKRAYSKPLSWYEITVSGLQGGHSGCEIHKERGNANVILGRVLQELRDVNPYVLYSLEGGSKDNVIPSVAKACIGMRNYNITDAIEHIMEIQETLHKEYRDSDADIRVKMTIIKVEERRMALTHKSAQQVLALLNVLPNGVQNMSLAVPGLVETSLNLGIMKLDEKEFFLQHCIRSSVTSRKYELANRIKGIVTVLGGKMRIKSDYPAWEYRDVSLVRDKAVAIYQELFEKEPVIEGIHAGLECGLLASKIKNLDCVALGPDILDIHTTSERLSISSTKRMYEFIVAFLERKNGDVL